MYLVLAVMVTACQKETATSCGNPESTFQAKLTGTYQQVGFKNAVFPNWSYSSAGPVFSISMDSITEPYTTRYQVMDHNTIYLIQQNQLVDVAFGDTVVWAFQNGDSTKLIKL